MNGNQLIDAVYPEGCNSCGHSTTKSTPNKIMQADFGRCVLSDIARKNCGDNKPEKCERSVDAEDASILNKELADEPSTLTTCHMLDCYPIMTITDNFD